MTMMKTKSCIKLLQDIWNEFYFILEFSLLNQSKKIAIRYIKNVVNQKKKKRRKPYMMISGKHQPEKNGEKKTFLKKS